MEQMGFGYENERRLTDRMEKYWNYLRNEEKVNVPLFSKFNPEHLADLHSSTCDIKILQEGKERVYYYTRVGDALRNECGDLENHPVSKMAKRIPGGAIISKIDEYLDAKNFERPLFNVGTLVNKQNKIVKFRSCALLFGDRNYNPDHIVLGLSWRVFS
jgi:hypothetical protein